MSFSSWPERKALRYVVTMAPKAPPLNGNWQDDSWADARVGSVGSFHPQSTVHRPRTQFRVMHSGDVLYVIFRVEDQFVRSRRVAFQEHVSDDSCVEFFARPRPDRGYFNFEINCGGTMLLYYIEDPTREGRAFVRYTAVEEKVAHAVRIFHSMPKEVNPEVETPVTWIIQYEIPLVLFEAYVGAIGKLGGQSWTANFFKCGEMTSHPHWASWSPIGEELNFHQPQFFGSLEFEGESG